MKIIILGAGFTGLAAGIKTGAPIYEASDKAGGICRSYNKEGFDFAVGGGHWVFGKNKGYDYIKSLVPLNEYERKASVYYNTKFPYPFQTTADKFIENIGIQDFKYTLKDWLLCHFGRHQCNLFFHPFNEKYTAGLYDEIIQDDEYKTPPAGGVGFVSTFSDPIGGLGTVVDKMAEQCNIHYKKRAIKIYRHEVEFEDGSFEYFDKIISTIPLNNLLSMCGKQDFNLPYTSVLVLNIGAELDINLPDDHWLYVPFCKSGFYRIGFYSNVDKSKAPEGKVSLSVEMAFRDIEYKDLDVEKIAFDIIQELQSWRFIKKVITIDPTWVKCAYTWLRNKDEATKHIAWLKERDIISIGRYGKWKFQGFTQSIQDGLEVDA